MSPTIRYAGTLTRIRAITSHRALYEIGAEIQPARPIGRPPAHPAYVLLIFSAIARVARSTIRVETDLQDPDLWRLIRESMIDTLRRENLDLPDPGPRPPAWHHWRRFRDDHLATDEGLARLAGLHLPRALDLAHDLGLLLPNGPSSLTHPSALRTVYGDGTVVRPLYRPPRTVHTINDDGSHATFFINPTTGELESQPSHRYDPDIAEHRGHAGPALGHGYVAWHARGPGRYQRVMLHLGHIEHPGGEAATAVQLLGDVHRAATTGIHVVVYDGAFRGTHIEEIMTRYGYLVIAKQPVYTDEELATTPLVRTQDGKRARSIPLGVVTHDTPLGACAHTLAAINGMAVELGLDDSGDPISLGPLHRGAIKRARRQHGHYHFNLGYRIECPHGDFDTWLSPHPQRPGDPRPEALRALPDGDFDNLRLRGLRSDAESVHSGFKRTLLVDRAMTLGWRRGLVEYYTYAWYTNALAEQALRASRSSGSNRPAVLR